MIPDCLSGGVSSIKLQKKCHLRQLDLEKLDTKALMKHARVSPTGSIDIFSDLSKSPGITSGSTLQTSKSVEESSGDIISAESFAEPISGSTIDSQFASINGEKIASNTLEYSEYEPEAQIRIPLGNISSEEQPGFITQVTNVGDVDEFETHQLSEEWYPNNKWYTDTNLSNLPGFVTPPRRVPSTDEICNYVSEYLDTIKLDSRLADSILSEEEEEFVIFEDPNEYLELTTKFLLPTDETSEKENYILNASRNLEIS